MKIAFLKSLPQTIGMLLFLIALVTLVVVARTSAPTVHTLAHALTGFAFLTGAVGAVLVAIGAFVQNRPGRLAKRLAKSYAIGGAVYLLFGALIGTANWFVGIQ